MRLATPLVREPHLAVWARVPGILDRRVAVRIAVVAVAYFAAARFGLSLAFTTKQVTTVWPPTGIALVAFLVWGIRVWPGVQSRACAPGPIVR